jgi:hypothetical protein
MGVIPPAATEAELLTLPVPEQDRLRQFIAGLRQGRR